VKLAVFDLEGKKMTAIHPVDADPDVLAFDNGFGRLYVSASDRVYFPLQIVCRKPVLRIALPSDKQL
jgi:hypothetical protein